MLVVLLSRSRRSCRLGGLLFSLRLAQIVPLTRERATNSFLTRVALRASSVSITSFPAAVAINDHKPTGGHNS